MYDEARDAFLEEVFDVVVLPKLKQYGWYISWGNGAVVFTKNSSNFDDAGSALYNKTITSIEESCEDICKNVLPNNPCGALWEIVNAKGSNCREGYYKIPTHKVK